MNATELDISKRPFDPARTRQRLTDIARETGLIAAIVERGEAAFLSSTLDGALLRNAAMKSIEVIAEATRKLHSDYKACFPEVPWSNIYKMKTRLTHHSDKVDDTAIWNTLVSAVPELTSALSLPTDLSQEMPLPEVLR